jgi:hypothetical protein
MTMDMRDGLQARLDEIGRRLALDDSALALIGLGSVGRDTARLDAWSDLDFFVIVQPGAKTAFIDNLDWLAAARPLAWHFQNTADGHKALMDDGVFCEFAVFEPHELAHIPFAPGRVVWKRDGVDDAIAAPALPLPAPAVRDTAWLVNEALSNLYVGLLRWHRGERLAALRMVQGYAVERLVELMDSTLPAAARAARDPFSAERRFEQRHANAASLLAGCLPGYAHTPAGALAVLQALHAQAPWAVNEAMSMRIRALAAL